MVFIAGDKVGTGGSVKMECQYDKVPRRRGDASDTGAHHICQPAF